MIDASLERVLAEARQHMQKSIDHFAHELTHIRAGRATPAMVDEIRVEAYGQQMPLNQLATISAPQPDLIVIQPWDKGTLGAIERAIQAANLGFNPTNDGQLIRIVLPPLTEERRRELTKSARALGEEAKVAVRNIRRQAKDDIRKTTDAENLSEDMRFEAEEQLQKLTDEFTGRVDEILARKEKEIMAV